MEIILRQEQERDFPQVFALTEEAFRDMEISRHNEHFLIEKLRISDTFIPELSIVAEIDNKIAGHILLTKLQIKTKNSSFETLSLAPVSVKPEFQRQGIGGMLIRKAHEIAKQLGYKSIILVGHENYYPRFGYELLSKYGIILPFEVPDENAMIIGLTENALDGISGVVEYPKEFFEI